MQLNAPIIYKLEDKIVTNYSGYNQLARLYHFCLEQPKRSNIHLDFSWVEWFDGNLCALLSAIIYQLKKTHDFVFSADEKEITNRFDVLIRNGFVKTDSPVYDERKSTIPVQAFANDDKEGFCDYVTNELLSHRGIPENINDELKERITDDLLEVFCNTNFHANTYDPFFVGGQYYPRDGLLKFSMVDLGIGFLPRIEKATNGKINNDLEAIQWALKGNSTKMALDQCPGGLGIKNMFKYCKEHQGVIQIISNKGFWSSDLEGSLFQAGRELPSPFLGTTINLFFKKI